jgi:hypothetical protein
MSVLRRRARIAAPLLFGVFAIVGAACAPPPVAPPAPVQCDPGSFSATGNAPCTLAPAGTFVDTAGAVAATPCAIGSYQSDEGQVSCLLSPAGFFVDFVGAAAASPCPLGRYQPLSGQPSCIVASLGFYVDFLGAAASIECPPGTTTLNVGSTSLADCV